MTMKELENIMSQINEAQTTLTSLLESRVPGEHGARRSIRRAEAELETLKVEYAEAYKTYKTEESAKWDEYKKQKDAARKMNGVTVLNDGNPSDLGESEGNLFTVSPSTAKKGRGYYTDKPVPLTKYEKQMPGVVVAQNRGMIFSSAKNIHGNFVIPTMGEINLIVVDEKSRKLRPIDDVENRISWKGNGDHVVKDVVADGQGQHWFCTEDGELAHDLWFKLAKFGYGLKGMVQPGRFADIGVEVVDHWGVVRRITLGNTLLVNSSLVKGLDAYKSLEDLLEHAEEWGLTTMLKQWQSGDHIVAKRRIMGTQPNATNLALTYQETEELLKPEAREIWATKFEKVAWMKSSNICSSRGRALAARPSLLKNELVMNKLDSEAGNTFLRLAQGKFMAEGSYLKMYQDELAFSYAYVHGMDVNEAAKKAASKGLHGEIRVNPSFAGMYTYVDENGVKQVGYKKKTYVDAKGRYIETALVRYPHGAPSETIIVKVYLDKNVPDDVIVFPLPVANDDGTIPVKVLYAFRLQGADFDGDAVTAYTEEAWLEAQKRNAGKSYMIIPVNTEGTEKDKTLVDDDTWEDFCKQKVASLSNRVGLIATSLKYFFSQCADDLRMGADPEMIAKVIVYHACAMGDDIDEFKHGKALVELMTFVIDRADGEEFLKAPYFNRYACKYKSEEAFAKARNNKDGSPKTPGSGVLDMYAVAAERLMQKAGLQVVEAQTRASDGKDRWYYTVHPVQWESAETDLDKGEHFAANNTALPVELENLYGIEHGKKLSAKDLFQILYRDHAATLSGLVSDSDDDDQLVKAVSKLNERIMLAKLAIVAWTQAMKKAKDGEEIRADEALKLFTAILVQHREGCRSTLDVLTRTGTFKRADGTPYEKTIFDAQRLFYYFLDICGDGLFMLWQEKPEFPEVSEKVLSSVSYKEPDMEKAWELVFDQCDLLERMSGLLSEGVSAVVEELDKYEDTSVLNDGSFELSVDELPDDVSDLW